MPGGKLGTALQLKFRKRVLKCRCDPTCDRMLLSRHLTSDELSQAEELASELTLKEQTKNGLNDALGVLGGRCMQPTSSNGKQVNERKGL